MLIRPATIKDKPFVISSNNEINQVSGLTAKSQLSYNYEEDILNQNPKAFCLIAEENNEYFSSEEASKVRKELNHLSFITREVLIRFYFGNQSVSDIA